MPLRESERCKLESLAATDGVSKVAGRKVDRITASKRCFPDSIEWEAIDITKSEAPRKPLSLIRKIGGMGHLISMWLESDSLTRSSIYSGSGHGRDQCGRFTRNGDTAFHYFRNVGKGTSAIISSWWRGPGHREIAAYSRRSVISRITSRLWSSCTHART